MQLPLNENSKKQATINTHKGLFQYNRVPFGITLAPAIFQSLLCQGCNDVVAHQDDILVISQKGDENLHTVLFKLRAVGLHLKQYGQPSKAKVKAIHEIRRPSCVTELKSLLRHVKLLCEISAYFGHHIMFRKNVCWDWGKAEQVANSKAKQLL